MTAVSRTGLNIAFLFWVTFVYSFAIFLCPPYLNIYVKTLDRMWTMSTQREMNMVKHNTKCFCTRIPQSSLLPGYMALSIFTAREINKWHKSLKDYFKNRQSLWIFTLISCTISIKLVSVVYLFMQSVIVVFFHHRIYDIFSHTTGLPVGMAMLEYWLVGPG